MTVLQIVKALAGEEDLNFGDSDTTFSRQTRTGSTTNIHYIDSKSIPANSLGGVIDTYLHTQNTDTGTTASTFVINSGGSSVTLSSSGLSANRLFTFPSTETTQQLVGSVDIVSTGSESWQGAKRVGVYDVAGHFTNVNVETVLAEIAVSMVAILLPYGYKRGFTLGYSSASVITLTQGIWHHAGTTDQMVYSAGAISYAPAGLSGDQLQYIYLDDSAIASAGTQVITATQLTNSVTAPSYSNTKYGWYNGNDRCIGALAVASGNIASFAVTSDSFYLYTSALQIFDDTCPTTGAEASLDFSAYVPSYSTKARVIANLATDANSISFWRLNTGTVSTKATTSQSSEGLTLEPYLNTDQTAYWSCEAADAGTIAVTGYYIGDL